MKILSCFVENFVSYKQLDFEFDNKGLCLIQGPTGAGKSTLCDVIPWILFGVTAKNGAVDEVLNWNAVSPTIGTITLDLYDDIITIERIRGSKNDLYYLKNGHEDRLRGKDLQDTQKQINELLGFDSSTYLAASYYHEFSPTAQFFTATAKQRRQLCENLVDLKQIQQATQKLTDLKKETSKQLNHASADLMTWTSQIKLVTEDINILNKRQAQFKLQQKQASDTKIADIKAYIQEKELDILKYDVLLEENGIKLTAILAKMVTLPKTMCLVCKQPTLHEDYYILEQTLQDLKDMRKDTMHEKANDTAQLLATRKSLKDLPTFEDPYPSLIKSKQEQLEDALRIEFLLENEQGQLHYETANQELLEPLIQEARRLIIASSIKQIESNSNQLLTDYFDAEIQVSFDVAAADKLDVTITKDGNTCAFTQLSKGQRQLLKLCFGVSVMKQLQNYKESRFNIAFFDESLDGLSDDFKRKAFNLFNNLQNDYESVFVVEHSSDFKALCDNQIEVINDNGVSSVKET